jgi:hypothetical protein
MHQNVPLVKSFITENNTLLVTVDNLRFYEFRDLTPRDVLWIDHINESDMYLEDFTQSLTFLSQIIDRVTIFASHDLQSEDWKVYIEITDLVQEYVLANRVVWKDFLSLVFASGHKSFNSYHFMMDLPLQIIHDFQQIIVEFYEQQQRLINESKGIHK